MAKITLERRIINYIQDAYTGDLQDGKDKIIIVKLADRVPIEELSYLYTMASDLANRFGCLTLFVDNNIRAIDVQTMRVLVRSRYREPDEV